MTTEWDEVLEDRKSENGEGGQFSCKIDAEHVARFAAVKEAARAMGKKVTTTRVAHKAIDSLYESLVLPYQDEIDEYEDEA
jgi:hypothetical protein